MAEETARRHDTEILGAHPDDRDSMPGASPAVAPGLELREIAGVPFLSDEALNARSGILIAFSMRIGGVSASPYDSLNLAAHVGDDPIAVDENRQRFTNALGIGSLRDRLVASEQVHGTHVVTVGERDAGRGAFAAWDDSSGSPGGAPVPATDALITLAPDVPLLMLYADCVPVVLVCERPRAIAVVHAGWRGALASLPGKAAIELAHTAGAETAALTAYIGPHVGACCYEVDETLLSRFVNTFGTIAAVDGRLDLSSAVVESLVGAGLRREAILDAGTCTLDHAEEYFSYRASRVTGRHGALAVLTKVG